MIQSYVFYCKFIYFNIFKLILYVLITEMAEEQKQQQQQQQQVEEDIDMEIPDIFPKN